VTRCLENPFQFGCICLSPMIFQKKMSLRVFDTQLGAQSMKFISELQHRLAPLLTQNSPSHVLVFIVSNRVILFLDCIHKKNTKWARPIYSKILYGSFLPASFPPMFGMGESLKECEGDHVPVRKIVNMEISFWKI
jgi:hypothetical protein